MNRDIDPLIGGLASVTDRQAGALLSEDAATALADRITATAVPSAAPRGRRSPIMLIGLPLAAAGVAGAAVTAVALARAGGPGGTPAVAPASPRVSLVAALSFTRKGGYIDVRVRDPLADPKRYTEEFAAHGLKVTLSMVPASPSIVGTVLTMETSENTAQRDVTTITAKGECETGGGGDVCPVGVRIRTGYKGTAAIVFGREARPGEQYTSTAAATAPGEVMHGMTYRAHRVGEVLAALRKRHVTVPEYRAMDGNVSKELKPGQVPPTWYVHDAVPWAKNQVLLFVGPEPTEKASSEPPSSAPPGVPASPSPTPTG
ncbi:hypothetical protein BKA00_004080 [Actinomadura coerulea]|uniref:Uncharacterized protein n=1 Tax=Actinomadura coerulea TaxID=46159 RepID=A0A7X0G2E2_9ACTN|nr:hypothetical protein [Actinomadura coerulea]MBB6397166.1 hypothetical protein [Actinomadura coerulea]GGP96992.1 hypothetical protein GCM10010187_11080 [Actinomadura coerulea]